MQRIPLPTRISYHGCALRTARLSEFPRTRPHPTAIRAWLQHTTFCKPRAMHWGPRRGRRAAALCRRRQVTRGQGTTGQQTPPALTSSTATRAPTTDPAQRSIRVFITHQTHTLGASHGCSVLGFSTPPPPLKALHIAQESATQITIQRLGAAAGYCCSTKNE
jgi:hypothetical protein